MRLQGTALLGRLLSQLDINGISENVCPGISRLFQNTRLIPEFDGLLHHPLLVQNASDGRDMCLFCLKGLLEKMHLALTTGKRILVHCAAGISRSPAIVIAYLLATAEESSVDTALERIRVARPCAEPNSRFLEDLATMDFKGILRPSDSR